MDLRYQLSAMYVIMLEGEVTHPWSATKGGNTIPATIAEATKIPNYSYQQLSQSPDRAKFQTQAAMIYRFKKQSQYVISFCKRISVAHSS